MKDIAFTESLIKLFIALPAVLLAAYASIRFGGKALRGMNGGRHLEVLETVPVHHKAALSIVRIGETYQVLGVTEHAVTTIRELSQTEAESLRRSAGGDGRSLSRVLRRQERKRKGTTPHE